MHNIQKLIDKPIIIQAEGSVELSHSKKSRPLQGSESYIEEEVMPRGSEEDSIAESIPEQSEQQQLSSARRLLGSEQSVI